MTTDSPSVRTRLLEARVFLDDATEQLDADDLTDDVEAICEDIDAVLAELDATDEATDTRQSSRRSPR
ncbi:hypothetical protein [Haloarcula sp. JP-L23]|uniref:hypothetical protein n=1 Tax=Haloarcula sp. JP-L23 TaxID=2716717 RepID=UPI00140EC256|nr:hypothetical protein G9465_09925 [Haloarcula sp. JP-L23]